MIIAPAQTRVRAVPVLNVRHFTARFFGFAERSVDRAAEAFFWVSVAGRVIDVISTMYVIILLGWHEAEPGSAWVIRDFGWVGFITVHYIWVIVFLLMKLTTAPEIKRFEEPFPPAIRPFFSAMRVLVRVGVLNFYLMYLSALMEISPQVRQMIFSLLRL